MFSLINKFHRKLRLTKTQFVRSAIDRINWGCRLIAIRGAKGVGKTTLMLQYMKIHHLDLPECIYVSLDDVYFSQHSFYDFVEIFYKKGGKRLFVDEVHKYPKWSIEVKNVYDDFPDLQVVISGSSLLNILNGDADLSRRCVPYEVQGLSFREYMQLCHNITLPVVSLDELLDKPQMICEKVNENCRPLAYFNTYLRHGYYPFILEGSVEYPLRVENIVEYVLNVELPQLCGVDVASVRTLKSLLAVLAENVPLKVDITKLSTMVGVSRPTLLGYLQALNRAKIVNLLYSDEEGVKRLQKPDKIYLENPNLMEVFKQSKTNPGTLRECFLVGQLKYGHKVEYTTHGDVLVDRKYTIEVGGKSKEGKQISSVQNGFIAADDIDENYENKIPLWAFGLLY